MKNLNTRRLSKNDENLAKRFLYEVYANEIKWIPPADNLSGWIVKEDKSGKYFSDIFAPVSNWCGVFDKDRLVATGRVIIPIHNKLDVELYCELPQKYLINGIKRAEINRVAITGEYNNSKVFYLLIKELFSLIIENQIDYIFSGVPPKTIEIIQEIGFKKLIPPVKFKYSKEDPYFVDLMVLDCTNPVFLKRRLEEFNVNKLRRLDF